jgi:hypothetical protein
MDAPAIIFLVYLLSCAINEIYYPAAARAVGYCRHDCCSAWSYHDDCMPVFFPAR